VRENSRELPRTYVRTSGSRPMAIAANSLLCDNSSRRQASENTCSGIHEPSRNAKSLGVHTSRWSGKGHFAVLKPMLAFAFMVLIIYHLSHSSSKDYSTTKRSVILSYNTEIIVDRCDGAIIFANGKKLL